jgi:hypothetical protein
MSEHEDHEHDFSEGHYLSKIPLTTLYRWFMYDIHTENPNNHVDIFKITAVSDEGDEKEQEESRLRMEQIQELLPLMNLYSTMTAQYVFEMQKREVIDEVSPEIVEKLEKDSNKMKQFYKLISLSALMTMLSSAVELGILSTEGSLIDVDEIKE